MEVLGCSVGKGVWAIEAAQKHPSGRGLEEGCVCVLLFSCAVSGRMAGTLSGVWVGVVGVY